MPTAVYPGSFDPITFGHVSAIADAAKAFGSVVVAIGVNPDKKYMFSPGERESLVRAAVGHIPGVTVTPFSGLLVHYMVRNHLHVVVRGLRNAQDLNDAMLQDTLGWQQSLAKDIQVFYVPARVGNHFTSSSALKNVMREQGHATHLAPLSTLHAVQARMLGQYVYGVTGASAAGKSFVCRKFKEIATRRHIPLTHIDLDSIAHEILSTAQEPLYKKARLEVLVTFGSEVAGPHGTINRKALGRMVFEDPAKLTQLNAILHEPIFFKMNDRMRHEKGIFLVDAALLAESGKLHLAHNHILLVKAPKETRQQRLVTRDKLDAEQIDRRLKSQFSSRVKAQLVEKAIQETRYGALDQLTNDGHLTDKALEAAFDTMLSRIDLYGQFQTRLAKAS